MTDIRWAGLTHAEIYERVQAGPGRGASVAVESAWADTEAVIVGIEQRLSAAIAEAGGGWEGHAADATRAGLTPLGRWAADAAGDARLTAGGVTAQGEQAAWLRAALPSPTAPLWDEPGGRPASDPLYLLVDTQALEQRSAADAAQAVHLMNTYTSNSYDNIRAMDYWTLPPTVTVEAIGGGAAGSGTVGPLGLAGTDPAASGAAAGAGQPGAGGGGAGGGPGAGGGVSVPPAGPVATPSTPPSPNAPGALPPPTPTAALPPLNPPAALPNQPSGRPPGSRTVPPVGAATTPGGPVSRPPTGDAGARVPPVNGPLPGRTPPASAPAGGGGVRPAAPGAPVRPAPAPSWRDLVPISPDPRAPGAPPWPRGDGTGAGRVIGAPGEPMGSGSGTGAAAEEPLTRGAGNRASSPAHPGLYPPMMGMGMGAPDREHRRPDYLLDDGNAFADHRWFPPPVIAADDLPPPPRLH